MSIYQTVDTVPLSFIRVRGGALVTGLSLSVKVVNAVSGVTLLAITAMTEVTPGVYAYNWTHGLATTVATECIALYTVGGQTFAENITLSESMDKDEALNTRAV